jgi:histone deacetylase 1/2
VCQVCEKHGHSARKCYHCFDLTYQHSSSPPNKQAFIAANNGGWENDWHAETGVTHHITHDMANLNLKSDDYTGTDQLQVGNGQGLHISKTGNSSLHTSSHSFVLNQVLLVPQIQKNLLSVQKFCTDNNVYFEFHDQYFLVKDYSGTVLHRGYVSNGLYHFSTKNVPPQAFSSVRISFDQWHRRLGHAASQVVQRVLSSNKLLVYKIKSHFVCLDCQLAKSHALPFTNSTYVLKSPLDLIFTNVWGPASVASTTGARYYVSFLDNYSKFLWLVPIKFKSDVERVFLQFQCYVEKQFSSKIKAIQSDWGGEYRRLHNYFQANG